MKILTISLSSFLILLLGGCKGDDVASTENDPNVGAATEWKKAGELSTPVVAFAYDPPFLLAGSEGIYRSADNGDTWIPVNNGLPAGVEIQELFVSPTHVFAGTNGDGIFRSADHGDTWTAVNVGLTSGDVEALTAGNTFLFAGTRNGVFRSDDGGDSWVSMGWLVEPFIESLIFYKSYLFAGTLGHEVIRSSDNGETWERLQIPSVGYRHFAVIEPFLFAGGWGSSMTEGVYRTSDNGETWESISQELGDMGIHRFATVGADLYCLSITDGVRHSGDAGDSWKDMNEALPVGEPDVWFLALEATGGFLFCSSVNLATFEGAVYRKPVDIGKQEGWEH